MAEEKTYVFGEGAGNNGILSLLGPMLSQRGVDPNVLLAMQGRNNDGFGEGGWFIWVIFLFFLMGWGGNGFGNNGAGGLVTSLIMIMVERCYYKLLMETEMQLVS